MKMLTRRGVLVQEEEGGSSYLADADADSDEARALRPLQVAACTYRIAFGPRAGQKVLTMRGEMASTPSGPSSCSRSQRLAGSSSCRRLQCRCPWKSRNGKGGSIRIGPASRTKARPAPDGMTTPKSVARTTSGRARQSAGRSGARCLPGPVARACAWCPSGCAAPPVTGHAGTRCRCRAETCRRASTLAMPACRRPSSGFHSERISGGHVGLALTDRDQGRYDQSNKRSINVR